MQRGLTILILVSLILPSFAFAEGSGVKIPEDWNAIKAIGQKLFDSAKNILPNSINKVWNEEVLPLWRRMGDWTVNNILNPYIYPIFNKEIKNRGPIIEAEFQKETNEIKESVKTDLPKETKSIWEKLKNLIW